MPAGGLAAQFAVELREWRSRREKLLELRDGAEGNLALVERVEALLADTDRTIRDLDVHVARLEARRLRVHLFRLDQEIQSCRLSVAARTRRSRTRCQPRSRRDRTSRTARGSPARSTDDDPVDPPPRVIYEHAAAFRGDRRVAWWLERWADEALGLGDDALWPRWTA